MNDLNNTNTINDTNDLNNTNTINNTNDLNNTNTINDINTINNTNNLNNTNSINDTNDLNNTNTINNTNDLNNTNTINDTNDLDNTNTINNTNSVSNTKNRKAFITIIIIVLLLIILSIIGIIGFKKIKNIKTDSNSADLNNIIFEYYLEDIKVNNMPRNDIIATPNDINNLNSKEYIFKRYNCTNNIIGKFNEEKWNFTTTGNDGVCKLYFVNAKYNVNLNIINGLQDDKNPKVIERENDGIFKIIPNEGYKFKSASCQNDKEAIWNEIDNTLTISAISSDIYCDIEFEKKELNVTISVINGSGNTEETVLYGESKSILIEPKVGYSNPKIQCSNNQNPVYSNNSLIFEKLTKETACKIVFNKIIIPIYNVTIDNYDDFNENVNIKISGALKENKVAEGNNFSIIITNTSENNISLNCGDLLPNETQIENASTKYEILDIKNDINCKIEIN